MDGFFNNLAKQTLGLTPSLQPVWTPMIAQVIDLNAPHTIENVESLVDTKGTFVDTKEAFNDNSQRFTNTTVEFEPITRSIKENSAEKSKEVKSKEKESLLLPHVTDSINSNVKKLDEVTPNSVKRDQSNLSAQNQFQDVQFAARTPAKKILTSRRMVPRISETNKPNLSISESSKSDLAGQRNSLTQKSSSTPTIQVNIGRVDVRAIMPTPASPTRKAPARPSLALSLEDYLKQRNG